MIRPVSGLPTKMVPLMILEILRGETDAEHHQTQQEIREKLRSYYEMQIAR